MRLPLICSQILGSVAVALALACGGGGGKSAPLPGGGGTGGGTVTVLPPQYAGDVYWVAYQDGNGPWKTAAASGGQYTFKVTDPAGRYGVAIIDETPGTPIPLWVEGSINYFTFAEVSRIDLSSLSFLTSATVSGSIAGVSGTDTAQLKVRSRSLTLAAGSSAYTFNAWSGNQDLLAIRRAGGGAADRLVVHRNLMLTNAAVLPAIDFAAQGLPLAAQVATVTGNDAADSVITYANWLAPLTSVTLAQASGTSLVFNALPAASHLADETHFIGGQASQSTGKACIGGVYTKSPIGVAITLPAKVATPSFGTAITSPYYRPVISWVPLSGARVSSIYAEDYYNYIFWNANFSAGWLAGTTATPYTFPDFSALAGWNNAWGLIPGSTLDWAFQSRWTSTPDAEFMLNMPRNHPEGERFWRSWYSLPSVPAALMPAQAPRATGEEDGAVLQRRPHWAQESDRP